jgi:hypothetical protein
VQRAAVAGGLFVWATPTVRSVALSQAQVGSPQPQATTTAGPPPGCTRTQGHWKNHADPDGRYDAAWDAVGGPDAEFFDTGKTYLTILNMEPRGGNAFLILAHQWIAAQLNIAAGAPVAAPVQSAFDEATNLLQSWSAAGDIPKSDPDRSRAIDLATLLDQYNNGNAGTPHCPD